MKGDTWSRGRGEKRKVALRKNEKSRGTGEESGAEEGVAKEVEQRKG
jgi:hypothetical protein